MLPSGLDIASHCPLELSAAVIACVRDLRAICDPQWREGGAHEVHTVTRSRLLPEGTSQSLLAIQILVFVTFTYLFGVGRKHKCHSICREVGCQSVGVSSVLNTM